MTAIRGAARAISPLLQRPKLTPVQVQGDQTKSAKTNTIPDSKDQPGNTPKVARFRSATAQRVAPQAPDVAPPPQISTEPPKTDHDIEVQKALQTAYEKFQESGGGELADLQRALYDSVWSLLSDAGVKDSPAEAAMAITEYLESLSPATATPDISRAANAGLASIHLANGPEGDSPSTTSNGRRVQLDIRV